MTALASTPATSEAAPAAPREPAPGAVHRGPAHGGHHVVQFYSNESFLTRSVGQFLGTGLAGGELILVIATDEHRQAFREHLERHSFDIDHAVVRGHYVEYDARGLLAEFMRRGVPDEQLFRERVHGIITGLERRHPGRPIRAYGEMVDLLATSGQYDAAIDVERLWNMVNARHGFLLLCAYQVQAFPSPSLRRAFETVCASHARVFPSEDLRVWTSDIASHRELAQLQERSHTLDREIGRRQVLEEALRQTANTAASAKQCAETAIRHHQLFAGMVGHDLRSPLQAILASAECLLRSQPDEKTSALAARIAGNSRRMARMIEQVADFARIQGGTSLTVERTPVDLFRLCTTLKAELEGDAATPRLLLMAEGDTVGSLDPARLQQVIGTLFGNALQHSPERSTVSVVVDGRHALQLVLTVTNQGRIPVECQEGLFEAGHGGAGHRSGDGVGLGLFLAREIARAHGGRISAASDAQHGTTFRLELPRQPQPAWQ